MARSSSYLAPLSMFALAAIGACHGDPTCADSATCPSAADASADGPGGNGATDGAASAPDGSTDGGNDGRPTLSGTGNPKWATRFGATYSDFVHAVAIDPSGDVYATGGFNYSETLGPVDFGGACGKTDGHASGFIARFSGVDGKCKWLKRIGGIDIAARGLAIALDSTTPSAPILLVAGYTTSATSNAGWQYNGYVKTPIGGVLEVIYSLTSAFLLRVSGTDGSLQAGFAGPSNANSEAYGIDFDPTRNAIVLCGKYAGGALQLDYEDHSSATFSYSAAEVGFVLELDTTSWRKNWEVEIHGGSVGAPTPARATSCTFDKLHRIVVAGAFGEGGVAFNGSSPLVSKGDSDGFVANLASANGAVVWATRFGSAKDDAVNGLRVGSDDNVYVAGSFGSSDGDFSSVPFVGGAHDAFVGRLTPGGTVTLVRGYGSPEDDGGADVAPGPSQEIVLTGFFGAAATIGGQKVAGALPREPFALKTDPNGTLVWARSFGTLTTPPPTADQSAGLAGGVAIAGNGDIALGGAFVGNVQFDKTKLSSAASYDAFVAKLAP
jgi:hypothetical protein